MIERQQNRGTWGCDAVSAAVRAVGISQGSVPLVVHGLFDRGGRARAAAAAARSVVAFTLRLAAPWWWLASLTVLVLTVVLLEWIDRGKQRSTGSE